MTRKVVCAYSGSLVWEFSGEMDKVWKKMPNISRIAKNDNNSKDQRDCKTGLICFAFIGWLLTTWVCGGIRAHMHYQDLSAHSGNRYPVYVCKKKKKGAECFQSLFSFCVTTVRESVAEGENDPERKQYLWHCTPYPAGSTQTACTHCCCWCTPAEEQHG